MKLLLSEDVFNDALLSKLEIRYILTCLITQYTLELHNLNVLIKLVRTFYYIFR